MTGVGTQTRSELSKLIGALQQTLAAPAAPVSPRPEAGLPASVDQLFRAVLPSAPGNADLPRQQFLNEYLGRLDGAAPQDSRYAHWPTLVELAAELGMDTDKAREIRQRVLTQWSKKPLLTELRDAIAELLADNGGLMTAIELAEALLLRRGSVQGSPLRERQAQAVVRAGVETELLRQESRWVLRRCGKRILIADNRQQRGEELADYAEALGQLADECAALDPLLLASKGAGARPGGAGPGVLAGLSNHRLLRLAVAAAQGAALSSRAEIYPRQAGRRQSLTLAQGALLGMQALSAQEVRHQVSGAIRRPSRCRDGPSSTD